MLGLSVQLSLLGNEGSPSLKDAEDRNDDSNYGGHERNES